MDHAIAGRTGSLVTAGKRVAVVDAGIGGLVTAAALRRRGFEATVFERAPQLRRQGTGLGLWTNMRSRRCASSGSGSGSKAFWMVSPSRWSASYSCPRKASN